MLEILILWSWETLKKMAKVRHCGTTSDHVKPYINFEKDEMYLSYRRKKKRVVCTQCCHLYLCGLQNCVRLFTSIFQYPQKKEDWNKRSSSHHELHKQCQRAEHAEQWKGGSAMSLKPTSRVPTCVGGRSLLLDQLVPQLFPQLFSKIEIVEGDGGVGTILLVTSPPAGLILNNWAPEQ